MEISREKYVRSSIGMMTFPTEWKHHPNVPVTSHHQPVLYAVASGKLYNLRSGKWPSGSFVGFPIKKRWSFAYLCQRLPEGKLQRPHCSPSLEMMVLNGESSPNGLNSG